LRRKYAASTGKTCVIRQGGAGGEGRVGATRNGPRRCDLESMTRRNGEARRIAEIRQGEYPGKARRGTACSRARMPGEQWDMRINYIILIVSMYPMRRIVRLSNCMYRPFSPEDNVASTVDEITINYSEDDQLLVKELDKEVLSKGAWATLMFKYQDWDRQKQDYGPAKFTIRRYRKINDEYRQQTKFNISSVDQANKIIAILQKWVAQV
jgi:hypothetical protein